jgi:acetyltransferase
VDVGGVKLNICNENELRSSYLELLNSVKSALPGADIWGVFVQEFVRGGKEIIIGMNRDPHFGALLMFGLGGIYVEVLKDVSFRVAPIRELSALHMIEEIRGYKILAGYRGAEPSDIESIVECLERLSQLVTDFEEISEIDINPLLVFERGKGCKVIDARILIGH